MVKISPANVLVVDDDPQVCSLIHDSLSHNGFKCTFASRTEHAKQLISDSNFDVIVADILMPDTTGLDLLAYTKTVAPDCKVILITGASNTFYLAEALTLGAYDYFQKPFDIAQLSETITKATTEASHNTHLVTRAANAMQSEPYLRRISLESIRALIRAVEAKDPYTRRHSEQVTHYAMNLAKFMVVPPDFMETIRIAALVHDVGKIGVPDHILTKAGPLTKEEYMQVCTHPVLGAEILENISVFAEEARLVKYHHECWDGTGYPDGLKGEAIPLGSRILNVCDSIDAMLMRRTYKEPYSLKRVVDELRRCAGTQFDPSITAAAVEWIDKHPDKVILSASAT